MDMAHRRMVHRPRDPGRIARERAATDEQLAVKTGHHYRSQASGEISMPQYALELARAEQLQAETLAWMRSWPAQPLEPGTLSRAGLRTWIERWDGERWVELEGSERAV
jgi:hypothetical protein